MSPTSDTIYVPETPGTAVDNDDIAVDDSPGGVPLLQANPNRKSALIINTGSGDMRVTTDGSAPTATHGKLVGAGSILSLSVPFCPIDVVLAFCADPGTTANASEVV